MKKEMCKFNFLSSKFGFLAHQMKRTSFFLDWYFKMITCTKKKKLVESKVINSNIFLTG